MVKMNDSKIANGKANAMSAGLQSGTRAPDEALRALARLSGEAHHPHPAPAAKAPSAHRIAEDEFDDEDDAAAGGGEADQPAAETPAKAFRPVRRSVREDTPSPRPGRPLSAERPLSFQVTMNPRELRKQLGVRVLQSIQMRLKKAAIMGQLSGDRPQTAQEIVEAALGEYLDKIGH